jgi:hypothetical protein
VSKALIPILVHFPDTTLVLTSVGVPAKDEMLDVTDAGYTGWLIVDVESNPDFEKIDEYVYVVRVESG